MKRKPLTVLSLLILLGISFLSANDAEWKIDSEQEWKANIESAEGLTLEDGAAAPTEKTATLLTKLHSSEEKRSAKSLTITQSAIWQNWNPIENLGPSNLQDAPVLLTIGPDNYWMFGRYGSGHAEEEERSESPSRSRSTHLRKSYPRRIRCAPRRRPGFQINTMRPADSSPARAATMPGRAAT